MRKIKEHKRWLDFYTSLEIIILIVLHIYANWFWEQPWKLYKEIHSKTLQINQNKILKNVQIPRWRQRNENQKEQTKNSADLFIITFLVN